MVYGHEFSRIYAEHWASWSDRVWPVLLKIVRTHSPHAKTWLDMGCGTGRLLQIMVRNNFIATGIDSSPHQLKYARRNVPQARVVQMDMRKFSLGLKFEIITCMYDSLNYLLTKADLGSTFRGVRRHLQKRGLFIFDVNTAVCHRTYWQQAMVIRGERRFITLQGSYDAKRSLAPLKITGFIKQGRTYRRFDELHVQRSYADKELDGLLNRAGFRFRKYHGISLSPAKKTSGRKLYVCTLRH